MDLTTYVGILEGMVMWLFVAATLEFIGLLLMISYYQKNISNGIKKIIGKGKFIKVWEFAPPNIVTEHTKILDANGAVVFNNQMIVPRPGNTFSLKRRAFGDEPLVIVPRGEVPTHIEELAYLVEDHTEAITEDIKALNDELKALYDNDKIDTDVVNSLKGVEKNLSKILMGVVLQPGDFLGRAIKYKLIDTIEVAKTYNNKILQILYRLKDLPVYVFILIVVVICLVLNALIFQNVSGMVP